MKKKSNLNLAKKSVNAVKVIEICPYHMPYAINAICFIVCKNLEEDCIYVYTMTPTVYYDVILYEQPIEQ